MYDAIIVGARCAGSPTAMLLARRGFKVLVVDNATDAFLSAITGAIPLSDFMSRDNIGRIMTAFFALEQALMANEALKKTMGDYHELVQRGRREVFRVES